MNRFKILYTDNTEFQGDPLQKDWVKIDDTKQIAKLEYVLGNSCILMEGFKEYNHLKECLGLQMQGYSKILLMGRSDGNTVIIVFDLQKQNIYQMEKPYGEEYGKQILRGWQKGKLNNPSVKFKKLDNV